MGTENSPLPEALAVGLMLFVWVHFLCVRRHFFAHFFFLSASVSNRYRMSPVKTQFFISIFISFFLLLCCQLYKCQITCQRVFTHLNQFTHHGELYSVCRHLCIILSVVIMGAWVDAIRHVTRVTLALAWRWHILTGSLYNVFGAWSVKDMGVYPAWRLHWKDWVGSYIFETLMMD